MYYLFSRLSKCQIKIDQIDQGTIGEGVVVLSKRDLVVELEQTAQDALIIGIEEGRMMEEDQTIITPHITPEIEIVEDLYHMILIEAMMHRCCNIRVLTIH